MQKPTVALILYPEFNPFILAVPQQVFSIQLDGEALFNFLMLSETGRMEQGNTGVFAQPHGDLSLLSQADIVVMSGWHDLAQAPSPILQQALQMVVERGATLVGLCYGAYPLAYSGVLNGKTAVTHWLAETDFRQRFPQVKLDTNKLYIEQDNLITSAGVVAGLDCCLAVVRRFLGSQTANKIARILVTPPHREGGQAQFIERPLSKPTSNQNINRQLEFLRQNLTQSHSIDEIASRLLMSRSTFTRHFRKATGMSFHQWLTEVRLQHACELLENSELSIEQIATESGFNSSVSFRQHFAQRYDLSPSQWRQRFFHRGE